MTRALIDARRLILTEVNAGNGKHAIFVPYPEGVSEVLKVSRRRQMAAQH